MASRETALARLARAVPAGVRQVIETLHAHAGEAVLVGGAVRDAFLGLPMPDWDVATDLLPGRVAELFPRVVRAGEKHGTIMVLTRSGPVEVTTYRGEGPYLDGRRPSSVHFLTELDADLARRDLTINAMAADLVGKRIVDPFGGEHDLRAGIIRCVGTPEERFGEDGLRPLRAIRFAAIFGFVIEPETREALASTHETFLRVAWERKRDELHGLLGRGHFFVGPMLELERSQMLEALSPELLGTDPAVFALLERMPTGRPWLRFTAWCWQKGVAPDVAGEVLRRWRVSGKELDHVAATLRALSEAPVSGAKLALLRRWVSVHGREATLDAATLRDAVDSRSRLHRRLDRLLATHPVVSIAQLAVKGQDLLDAGVPAKQIGAVLREALALVLDQPQKNDKAHLLRLAHTLSTGGIPKQ